MDERPPARRLIDLERGHRNLVVRRAAMRIVVVVGLLVGAYYLLPFDSDSNAQIAVRVVILVPMVVVAIGLQVRSVALSELPQLRAAEALASTAAMLIVVFAGTYLALSHSDRAAFTEPLGHTSALYFTVATLATVGYGDIAPRTDVARVFAIIHMVANVAVLGAAIKLMVNTAKTRLGPVPGERP